MATVYHDYEEQATPALRLARLRLHISEINAQISAAVADGGKSRDPGPLNAHLDRLYRRQTELQREAGEGVGGGAGLLRVDMR